MNKTGIEWTELTWNPFRGCSPVSSGCQHCYAKRMAHRFGFEWGKVALIEHKLTEPLHKRKPSVIFANSMSDTFHESVPDEWIDRLFAVMALCPQHRFLVITKRARRMREYFLREPDQCFHRAAEMISLWEDREADAAMERLKCWPLLNVGLGVSCEDQKTADERIPDLLATPAAMRFVSIEPMLGPITVPPKALCPCSCYAGRPRHPHPDCAGQPTIDWVISGGESGPGARPCHPDWVRSVRDQCVSAGVPFFFKGWGNRPPDYPEHYARKSRIPRLLDGKLWDQRPEGWSN